MDSPKSPIANFGYKKQDPNIAPRPAISVGIRELRDVNTKLRDENTKLRKRVAQLAEHSDKINFLTSSNAKLQDEISTLQVTVDELEGDVYTANTKLNEATKNAGRLACQLEQKSEEFDALVKATQALAEAEKVIRAELESDNKKIRNELAASNSNATEMSRLLDLANKKLKENDDEDANKQAHIESLIKQNAALARMLEVASKTPVASVSQTSAVPSEPVAADVVLNDAVQRDVSNTLRKKSGEQEQQSSRS